MFEHKTRMYAAAATTIVIVDPLSIIIKTINIHDIKVFRLSSYVFLSLPIALWHCLVLMIVSFIFSVIGRNGGREKEGKK